MAASVPPSDLPALTPAEEVRRRLEAFRQQRGYLLPHQGALAAALPDLQDAYGPFYRTLVQERHHLTEFESEFIWLVLLTAAGESLGTHHVDLFYRAGGTGSQAQAAFRLAAWSAGTGAYAFLSAHWQPHFPDMPAATAYDDGMRALLADLGLQQELARLALLSAHSARSDHWGVERAIRACYEHQIEEPKMVQALSLALWPCGINRFIEACDIWLGLMRAGAVQPSPAFQAWADTPDQHGSIVRQRNPG